MSWEPDVSLAIDEFRLSSLDIIAGNVKDEAFSVIPYFERLDLMEDIDSPFLQGSLEFSVLKGEMQSIGTSLTMQDFLLIEVSSIDGLNNTSTSSQLDEPRNIGGLFYITDIIKKNSTNSKVDSYRLHFASTEVLNEYSKKISKSYKNKTREEIIRTITDDFLIKDSKYDVKGYVRKGIFEPTSESFQCIIPRWSPVKSINWLKNGCVSTEDIDSKAFYFFQKYEDDLSRSFNFQSLNMMFKRNPSLGFNDQALTGYAITPINSDLNEVAKRTFARRTPLKCVVRDVSVLDKLSKGTFSSKLLSHDITRKKFTEKTFRYNNKHVANEKINVGLVLEENEAQPEFAEKFLYSSDCYVSVNSDHKNLFRKTETNLGVNRTEEWMQDLLSQRNIKDFITMDVTVYGDTNRNVGETVMFTSAGMYDTFDDERSKMTMDEDGQDMAGKYLITKLVHTFTKEDKNGSLGGKNVTTMTLVKDGWQST